MDFTTEPSGARFPCGKHTVAFIPRALAASGLRITSSGSTPSRSLRTRRSLCRRSESFHASSCSSSVQPPTVSALKSSSPRRRRCSITSGTPPARKTCTVG